MLTPTPAVPQYPLASPAGGLSIWVVCSGHTIEACSDKPKPHPDFNQIALTSHTDPCPGPLCGEGSHLCGPASCGHFEMRSAAEARADPGASSFRPCHPPPAVMQPVRLLSRFHHANFAQISGSPICALTLNNVCSMSTDGYPYNLSGDIAARCKALEPQTMLLQCLVVALCCV